MLPHGKKFLGAVNEGSAGSEGHIAVSRRHDGNQRRISDGEIADSVSHCQGDEIELGRYRVGHLLKHLARRGVPLIGEPLHALAMVVIAHIAREGHDSPGAVIAHGSLHRLEVEWSVDHFNKTNCAHAAIIGVLGQLGLGKRHPPTLP